ncbi:hypothetical protein [Rheinheimera soli]|uniref:Membrane protein YgcG n=1 Tax=Rheinheimera soli TaxID=443616 RepID=A0ABU1VUK6_9GAMM|nr:hypothetical protein [Rheinheimera soli]MDR7119367.1 putative membrane protein YgcG [Rheinheimera soli]
MKKVITFAAIWFAAAVFSSVPAMAQDAASVEALVTLNQAKIAQYQSQNMTSVQAETQTLADIKAETQALIEAAPDQVSKEAILQTALEAAALLCVVRPGDPDLNLSLSLCNDAVSAVLAAALAAGMSADSIAAVAAASASVDQSLIAQATASGGGTGTVAGPAAPAPGGTGFGGGSGGGGGTASGN